MEKKESILIVDDVESVRELLCQKLSGSGYRCFKAGNAEQALEILRSNTLALVILDIRMPGKSGISLLPEIKACYPNTAVVMATATTDCAIVVQCMKQGAYDYMTKPFDLDKLILNVDRALEKRRLELENMEYRQHLEEKVAEQAKKIRASFLSAIMALAYALEAKDKYTAGHSQRVAKISEVVAEEMGLPRELIERIRLAGLLHDIGKIGVRESILNKSSRLSDCEFQHISLHPGIGEHILAPIANDQEILKLVRNHHEHYDGNGYPDKISGTQIPLGARILAVADAFEAMTSERPYRRAMSLEAALEEIERSKGIMFDPSVASTFLKSDAACSSSLLVPV